jgi:hypothetical protein
MFAWAESPFDGTWKADMSKTQFAQKPAAFALQNGRYTCLTCDVDINVKADGSDQRVPGTKDFDTVAVKQVDDKTVQFTRKKDGKVVSEATATVSSDGKTLTREYKTFPPQGEPVTGKVVLTRVSGPPVGAHAMSGSWQAAKADASANGLTITIKATADGLSMSAPTGESYDAKFDGKDYPVKGDRAGGTVSLKQMNDSTIEETYKQDGKPLFVNTMTVQGKTMKYVSKDIKNDMTDTYIAEKQ